MHHEKQEAILILGAYGLIGTDVMRRLEGAGFNVVGLGRNPQTAARVLPNRQWLFHDISTLTDSSDWCEILDGIDQVVNCSGALQSSGGTDLNVLHHVAIGALAEACEDRKIRLIQVSAAGVDVGAGTEFMRSKARGDAAISNAMDRYVIIRPGLVLSHTGYGGTQLLRMIAAVPLVQCVAYGDARVQTVGIHDVTACVERAVRGEYAARTSFDLVERDGHSLMDVNTAIRAWLGFRDPILAISMPKFMARGISKIADGLGYLGWRSPLRSTAIQVLKSGVIGVHDVNALPHTKSMDETLAQMPATSEDRIAAQMGLMMPVVIGLLSVFWILSGVMGLVACKQAARVLTDVGWPFWVAVISVLFWSVVDIALGVGVLFRKYAARACLSMVGVGLVYMVFATVFVPSMWGDPLGPLVKIIPSIGLALVGQFLVQER